MPVSGRDGVSRRTILAGAVGALVPSVLSREAIAQTAEDVSCRWFGNQSAEGYSLFQLGALRFQAVDVRTVDSPQSPEVRYHDGSGTDNPEGLAQYTSAGEWESVVDGSVIS